MHEKLVTLIFFIGRRTLIGLHPLDPFCLSWKLKALNYNARFIQLAGEINSDMPRYWVAKVVGCAE